MNRLKVALVFAVLLAFGAGAVLGLGGGRSHTPQGPEARLAAELGLTRDQEKKIREIWSKAMDGGPQDGQRRDEIRREQDDEVMGMLTAEQKEKYSQVQAKYRALMEEMDRQRDAKFAEADKEMRAILTPEQLAKFDEIAREHRGPGFGPHEMHGPPPNGPMGGMFHVRPTTRL